MQSHAAENKTHGAKQKTAQIDFELFGTPAYKIRGVLFDTYVLAECGDHVYFIDQHAAHEKLLYDRLVASVESGGVSAQNLLIPYAFDVTYGDGEILSEHLDAFAACGFDIEKKTDTSFVLKAVPAVCTGLNIKDFLYNLLSDMENGRRQTDFIKESLMQAACKAAVKGEDRLSEGELNKLIRDISEANITLYCPHGRPIGRARRPCGIGKMVQTHGIKPKLVVIAGPTASGKSEMAVRIAADFDGEVVGCDSMQIYRGMDIGTGKITQVEKRDIPHHMIDIVSTKEEFSVSEYKRRAELCIADIVQRGKLPVLAGGTRFIYQCLAVRTEFCRNAAFGKSARDAAKRGGIGRIALSV